MSNERIRSQLGIGLIEILISLLLASLIMTALIQQYLTTKQQYRHAQTRLENATELQLIVDLIRDSTRKAGFTPCLGINHLMTIDRRNANENLPAILVMNGSDPSLKINRMSEYFDLVKQFVSPIRLLTTQSHILRDKHPVLIADCYHAEVQNIVKISQVPGGQIVTLAQPLAFTYHSPVYIGEWMHEEFFLRTHHRATSLFYQFNHADELTSTVHTMSLNLQDNQGHRLLTVMLGLDDGRNVTIQTMVRA